MTVRMLDDCIHSGPHYCETRCLWWRWYRNKNFQAEIPVASPLTAESQEITSSSLSEVTTNITEISTGCVDFIQGEMLHFETHKIKSKAEDISKPVRISIF